MARIRQQGKAIGDESRQSFNDKIDCRQDQRNSQYTDVVAE